MDRIKILDITGKESMFDDDSDIELETDVDYSDYTIFLPKDPQCSTSTSVSGTKFVTSKPIKHFTTEEKENDYIPTKLMMNTVLNFRKF